MSRLVIGIGNEFRCDDIAGLEVARRVQSTRTCATSLGGFELMELWVDAEDVVIVDAMRSNGAPGTVSLFEPLDVPLPATRFASTHAIGVAETIEMARELGCLPKQLVVIGIEAASVATGTTVSAAVRRAIAEVVADIDGEDADA